MKKRIGVIGSINTDLVVNTEKIPMVGETVEGKEFMISFGGKGANVAVASSRLGESVNLLSCVGDDIFSKNALAHLQEENVHITAVKQLKNEKNIIFASCNVVCKCAFCTKCRSKRRSSRFYC